VDFATALQPLRELVATLATQQGELQQRQLDLTQELQRWSQLLVEQTTSARHDDAKALQARLQQLEQTLQQQAARHQQVEQLLQQALDRTTDRLDALLQVLPRGPGSAATPVGGGAASVDAAATSGGAKSTSADPPQPTSPGSAPPTPPPPATAPGTGANGTSLDEGEPSAAPPPTTALARARSRLPLGWLAMAGAALGVSATCLWRALRWPRAAEAAADEPLAAEVVATLAATEPPGPTEPAASDAAGPTPGPGPHAPAPADGPEPPGVTTDEAVDLGEWFVIDDDDALRDLLGEPAPPGQPPIAGAAGASAAPALAAADRVAAPTPSPLPAAALPAVAMAPQPRPPELCQRRWRARDLGAGAAAAQRVLAEDPRVLRRPAPTVRIDADVVVATFAVLPGLSAAERSHLDQRLFDALH
jgi:hypothetical protein